MSNQLKETLLLWPRGYISSNELTIAYPTVSDDARYAAVKRAIHQNILTPLKRGLYLINPPYRQQQVDVFELAQILYGPSYISLESALSYHQWIPEAVYTTTSVCTKRNKIFTTPIGVFSYHRVQHMPLYEGVSYIKNKSSTFLIASPEKALIDYACIHKKNGHPSIKSKMT